MGLWEERSNREETSFLKRRGESALRAENSKGGARRKSREENRELKHLSNGRRNQKREGE